MSKLRYGDLLLGKEFPVGVVNGMATIIQPKLNDIKAIGFDMYYLFESFLVLTPKRYYNEITTSKEEKAWWDGLDLDTKNELTTYDFIAQNHDKQILFSKMFSFFLKEIVIFIDGVFVLLDGEKDYSEANNEEILKDIRGVISSVNFEEIRSMIRNISGIESNDIQSEKPKYKNKKAKEIWDKIHKDDDKSTNKSKTESKDGTLENIISVVSNRHKTISPLNVGELTKFQLIDAFQRLQIEESYEIAKRSVSVWGDEKGTFDSTLWYKNFYD